MIRCNPFSLESRTILITGASSGIGQSTAIECSRLGAKVIISGRNRERLNDTFVQLFGEGHQIITCDLLITENIDSLVANIPTIDGLVNNAGITMRKPIQFIEVTDFQNILQIDLIAPIILLKKLLKHKRLVKGSSIVFTSSIAGVGRTAVGNAMYTAAKGGISSFVRSAAKELIGKRMRVNAVCPAMVDTNFLNNEDRTEIEVEKDKLNYPLGRYATSEEIAWAIVYLLSNASSFVTGNNFIIDGGLTL